MGERAAEGGELVEGDSVVGAARAGAPVGRQPAVPWSFGTRVSSVLLGAWGALAGVAPHVLHHVGPVAGAAFFAGVGGQLLFAGVALVVSIPFLIRIHHRFETWVAPTIALVVMTGMFLLSMFVIGPAISNDDDGTKSPRVEQQHVDEHGHSAQETGL